MFVSSFRCHHLFFVSFIVMLLVMLMIFVCFCLCFAPRPYVPAPARPEPPQVIPSPAAAAAAAAGVPYTNGSATSGRDRSSSPSASRVPVVDRTPVQLPRVEDEIVKALMELDIGHLRFLAKERGLAGSSKEDLVTQLAYGPRP